MGMSTHVLGFVPPDEKWEKMKAIYNACIAGDIEIPQEVDKYFCYENPNNQEGLQVDINTAIKGYNNDDRNGFDVDLSKLPSNVKFIRFFNSY